MIAYNVQSLIDSVKDLTGQSNASNEKIIRGLNFGVDDYTRRRVLASGRFSPDSTNNGNIQRITTSITGSTEKLSLPTELISIRQVEVTDNNGKYQTVEPTDIQDNSLPLDTLYSGSGLPTVYDILSEHIYFYPTTDQSRTVRITYERAHPRFSSDNLTQDVGVLNIDAEYIVLYGAEYIMLGSSDSALVPVTRKLEEKRKDIDRMFGNRDQDRARKVRNMQLSPFNKRTM